MPNVSKKVCSEEMMTPRQKERYFINNFIVLKNLGINIGMVALFCLGFLLMSNQGYACSKKTSAIERFTCSKQSSIKTGNNICCQIGSCEKNKHHNNCNGVCGHSSCKCSLSVSSLNLVTLIELVLNNHFTEIEKEKFSDQQACYSAGFLSIWLPPKIS